MSVSFIIPAHNERNYLGPTLRALRRAARVLDEPWEIIVVDDGSTDDTAALAAGHGAAVISIAARHIAAARNTGARRARGDLLFFIDADTALPTETLRDARRALGHGAIGGGAPVAVDGRIPPSAVLAVGLWNVISRTARWAAGCFLFTRRDVFEHVGGFDERFFAAEEIELSRALQRRGPFTILRRPVITSARKLQAYPVSVHFRLMLRTLLTAGRAIRRREGLDIWYNPGRA